MFTYNSQQGIAVGIVIAIIAAVVLAGGATYVATQYNAEVEVKEDTEATTAETEQNAATGEFNIDLDLDGDTDASVDVDGALDAETNVNGASGNVDVNASGGVSY
jgi:hypothetical protein